MPVVFVVAVVVATACVCSGRQISRLDGGKCTQSVGACVEASVRAVQMYIYIYFFQYRGC